jgi:hypothetical protein
VVIEGQVEEEVGVGQRVESDQGVNVTRKIRTGKAW